MKPCLIYDDPRPIDRVVWPNDSIIAVGHCGVTAIVAYKECGLMEWTPYYAVYKGDDLVQRVPAAQVMVVYKQEAANGR